MSHGEESPNPEFELNEEGLEQIVAGAAGKIIEAEKEDVAAAAAEPGALGNIVQAHHMQTAGILRQEVRLIGSVLDTVVGRSDGKPWVEVIESRRAELGAPTS